MAVPGVITTGITLTVSGILDSRARSRARRREERLRLQEVARNNPDGLSYYAYPKDSGFFIDQMKDFRQGPLVDNLTNYERAFGVPKPPGYRTPQQIADAEFEAAFPVISEPVGNFSSVFFKTKRKNRKKRKKKKRKT